MQTMITRAEYLDQKASHEAYYRQFVTPQILTAVRNRIGVERVRNSTDPALNDIPLHWWDSMDYVVRGVWSRDQLRPLGECHSLSFTVCVCKQAGRVLVEQDEESRRAIA